MTITIKTYLILLILKSEIIKKSFIDKSLIKVITGIRRSESSFIICKVNRYDVHGKEILITQEKYYLADHGIQHAVFGYRDRIISGVLENIIFKILEKKG